MTGNNMFKRLNVKRKKSLPFTFLKKSEGFTLIEMLIVALIFSVVMGVATNLFVSAMKIQKYNLAHQQLLNQTSYALEYMARSIRMARTTDEIGCIDDGSNYDSPGIKFVAYDDICLKFFLEGEYLKITRGINTYNLTSADFIVDSFNVEVAGDDETDKIQPRVTISMEIRARGSGNQPSLRVQTTVSQRNLDVP